MIQFKFRSFIKVAAVTLLAAGQADAESGTRHSLTEDVAAITESYDKLGLSGGLLLAHQGEVMLLDTFGSIAPGKETAIDADTVLDTGSLTKQFTGAAILTLVEGQKLSVNDRLEKYFPTIPSDKGSITLHQLLTHSSGLQDFPEKGDFDLIDTGDFFKTVFGLPLHFAPGTEYRYSNVGYSVLARVIEIVTGTDFESYLQKTLFSPLGMSSTGYLKPDWAMSRVAETHRVDGADNTSMGSSVTRYLDANAISWVLKGNGGIHSTLNDMHLWMKALRDNRSLSQSSLKLLTSRHIAEDPAGRSHYGYGWAIFDTPRETKLVAHNGSNGYFFADVLWLQDEDAWVIFMGNSFSEQLMAIAWDAEQALATYLQNDNSK